MDSKTWLQTHDLVGEVRQHLSAYQLNQLACLERSNATLIDAGMPFGERKSRLSSMTAASLNSSV